MLTWKAAPALDINIEFFAICSSIWFMNSGKNGSMTKNLYGQSFWEGTCKEESFQILEKQTYQLRA